MNHSPVISLGIQHYYTQAMPIGNNCNQCTSKFKKNTWRIQMERQKCGLNLWVSLMKLAFLLVTATWVVSFFRSDSKHLLVVKLAHQITCWMITHIAANWLQICVHQVSLKLKKLNNATNGMKTALVSVLMTPRDLEFLFILLSLELALPKQHVPRKSPKLHKSPTIILLAGPTGNTSTTTT